MMQQLTNKIREGFVLPLMKKACISTIQTTQPQMCMMFLGQPKVPEELRTVDINNL